VGGGGGIRDGIGGGRIRKVKGRMNVGGGGWGKKGGAEGEEGSGEDK
jgi:hypothetical protein